MCRRSTQSLSPLLFFALFLHLFVGIGCANEEVETIGIVRVGEVVITSFDVERRGEVEALYGARPSREVAIVALVNESLEREVARSLGLLPTPEEIIDFRRHVEQTSKAPDLLQAIRDLFGPDSASFSRAFLEPRIIGAKLLQYQRYDTGAQQSARSRIETAYALIDRGSTFDEAAARTNAVAVLDTLEEKSGNGSVASRVDSATGAETAFHDLVDRLTPDVLYDQILETEYLYRIVRVFERTPSRTLVEVLTVPKEEYNVWLRRHAASVPIRFSDREIEIAIRRDYPQIWWLGGQPSS